MTLGKDKIVAPLMMALVFATMRADLAEAQVWGTDDSPTITFGASIDLANSFIWRGLEFSDKPNLQPGVWLGYGPFEIGTWASRAMDGDFHEQDLWITYYLPETSLGEFSLSLNDYYIDDVEAGVRFPDDFFDYTGVGNCEDDEEGYGSLPRCALGMHYLDVTATFAASAFPVELLLAYNLHNDPERALYGEAALRPSLGGFDFGFTLGGALGESRYYYETDGARITNLKAEVGHTLELGRISIPMNVGLVHNPHFEESFYVARAGILAEW